MRVLGSSADDALAEAFNATFKRETVQGRRAFTDERAARLTSFRWLHRYNTVCRRPQLGQQPPITYGRTTATRATLVAAARTPCPEIRGQAPGHEGDELALARHEVA